jgi:DNA-binding NarL/FixJ family response regulator
VVEEGVRGAFSGQPRGYEVFTCTGGARDLAELLATVQPRVAIVDESTGLSWQELADLCATAPQTNIIFLVHAITPELNYHCRESGIAGVVSRRLPMRELMDAVEAVLRGELVYEQAAGLGQTPDRAVKLSHREGQLVCLLTQGLKNKEIADELGVTVGTVKVYLSSLFRKVGARDRYELALYGLRNLPGELAAVSIELEERKHRPERPGAVEPFASLVVPRRTGSPHPMLPQRTPTKAAAGRPAPVRAGSYFFT